MSHREPVPTPPILPDRLGEALLRLQAALGRVRAAALDAVPAASDAGVPATAASAVGDDRLRLAEERDDALARAADLEAANAAALERLARAEVAIATVLHDWLGPEGGGDPHPAPPGMP